ncbi:MAG: hypothetical protein INR68_03175 [Methylobacterium mesophilicum]|nr:hypothetical protein [Methylobacterium mesophilicum]
MKSILLALAVALGSLAAPVVTSTASAQSIIIDGGGARVRDRDAREHRRDYRESRREREWRRERQRERGWRRTHRAERRVHAERGPSVGGCRWETRRFKTPSGRPVTQRERVCR